MADEPEISVAKTQRPQRHLAVVFLGPVCLHHSTLRMMLGSLENMSNLMDHNMGEQHRHIRRFNCLLNSIVKDDDVASFSWKRIGKGAR